MGKFKMPSAADVEKALYLKGDAKTAVVTYYAPLLAGMAASKDGALAPRMQKPAPGDWLDEHEEKGQSLGSFSRTCMKAVPHGTFNTIAMVLLGDMAAPVVASLKRYIEAFYQLNVAVVKLDVEARIKDGSIRSRVSDAGVQIWCRDAMDAAAQAVTLSRDLARRTIVSIGVSMYDLTPDEDWNYVYGQADLASARGVFSLARFSPEFNGERVASQEESDAVVLSRAAKVVTHELGHMFGLRHCIYFNCLMCGANNPQELIHKQPHLECPVCCKKLLSSFHWDLAKRYRDLTAACEAIGLTEPLPRLQAVAARVDAHHAGAPELPPTMGKSYSLAVPEPRSRLALGAPAKRPVAKKPAAARRPSVPAVR
eukprot:TRINITY_DN8688_c0_g1_i1.p1 TRINITY_DN8688_c0_g1~~TRINITY_DN8688_c0_g1_i1.p1  ORF type:complete len:369 (+),score=112.52 TRINITY_DN8688_c0_g1_i1:36-1142(+)